jgi:hypothetical protein
LVIIEGNPIQPFWSLCFGWVGFLTLRTQMTKKDIEDAIAFLEKIFVGPGSQDRLFEVIKSLKDELTRRNKK